ncbi:MAG: hypothetical protein NT103_02470 [Campylobacterales bacterium]|nr:hypothetical protein [Campylobacterales bacterium]
MAGVTFSFANFMALIDLNIGIASRLDENRSESFTILFCDFTGVAQNVIDDNLLTLLRTSDSIVHYEQYYFFVMPYTDRYGTGIVKRMFDEVFAYNIPSAAVCYPVNGENPTELLESLHLEAKKVNRINLDCLYDMLSSSKS